MEIEIENHEVQVDDNLIEQPPEEIRRQIEEYLNGQITRFTLYIDFPDNFTGKVMKELLKIPYGETRSYGEIADNLGTAPIAVGHACGRNPLPVFIPCHRVVGKNSIGGYRYGKPVKKKLLSLESASPDN